MFRCKVHESRSNCDKYYYYKGAVLFTVLILALVSPLLFRGSVSYFIASLGTDMGNMHTAMTTLPKPISICIQILNKRF